MFSGKRSLRNVHGLFAFLLAAALILAPVAWLTRLKFSSTWRPRR